MASYTPYYNLKKPADSDSYDIADHNGNMDKIDTALNTLNGKIATKLSYAEQTWITDQAVSIPANLWIPIRLNTNGLIDATKIRMISYIGVTDNPAAVNISQSLYAISSSVIEAYVNVSNAKDYGPSAPIAVRFFYAD